MSHTKHHTEALIVGTYDRGEVDRLYMLFTKDFGLLYAKARGVRKIHSKLRSTLQNLSHIHCSLIRAQDTWQLTNADVHDTLAASLYGKEKELLRVGRIVKLLKRLLEREEKNKALYQTVIEGLRYLAHPTLSTQERDYTEALVVMRILHALGYLGNPHYFGYLLGSVHVNDMLVGETGRVQSRAVAEINRSLRTIHL